MSEAKTKETFWDAMQKSSEPARSSPSWMKAGINLSERNFTTFRHDTAHASTEIAAQPASTKK
jgi:hypothetical protein